MINYDKDGYLSPTDAIKPLVQQLKYSGIFVPDNCIEGTVFGYKKPYAQNDIDAKDSKQLADKAITLVNNLIKEIKRRK